MVVVRDNLDGWISPSNWLIMHDLSPRVDLRIVFYLCVRVVLSLCLLSSGELSALICLVSSAANDRCPRVYSTPKNRRSSCAVWGKSATVYFSRQINCTFRFVTYFTCQVAPRGEPWLGVLCLIVRISSRKKE